MDNETRITRGTEETVDLQIVGAGLAGLVAANLAADAGLSVRLIERRADAGGRAGTADHHGYRLNIGPHALYIDGELRRVLLGLGLDPAGSPPDLAGATGSLGDRVGLLPAGPISLLRTRLLSPGAKWELARLMTRLPRLDPTDLASTTVDRWIDDITGRADLRALLAGLVNLSTYNPAADLASADVVVAQLQMALSSGVRYVDRGWGSIVAALSERADRLGVARLEAAVTEVAARAPTDLGRPAAAPSSDGSTGSTSSDGSTGSASTSSTTVTTATIDRGVSLPAVVTVIAAGGPAVADRLLGLDDHHVAMAGPPVEVSVLDLGLDQRPPVGAHLGLDRRLYATVHSVAAGLAPDGRHLVSLARYRRPAEGRADVAGRDPDDGDSLVDGAPLTDGSPLAEGDSPAGPDQTRAELLAHARAMGIDPTRADMERYLHRLTVANGMPLASRGGLAGRPPVEVEGRTGVFVAGDWVGGQGLLADAAAASAVDAVAAACAVARPGRRSTMVEA